MENVDTEEATQDNTQEEQVSSPVEEQADEAEMSPESPSEEQPADDTEDIQLLAGKFKTPEDLEKSYRELESKLGNYKEVEEKARAFEQLRQAPTPPVPLPAPNANDYIDADGNIDLATYERDMANFNARIAQNATESARFAAQETIDRDKVEQEFPEIKTDDSFAKSVVSLYRQGFAPTLLEAAKEVNKLRSSSAEQAKREGAAIKEREISQKIQSTTERSRSTSGGNLTEEDFAKLPLDQKRAIINSMVNEQ